MTDLDDLAKRIVAFRDARDWKKFHNPKDMAISLSLEASELLELFQWKTETEAEALVHNKRRIAEELADVLYWVLLISHDFGIDLVSAFRKKMNQNKRKYPVPKSKGKATKYTRL